MCKIMCNDKLSSYKGDRSLKGGGGCIYIVVYLIMILIKLVVCLYLIYVLESILLTDGVKQVPYVL